MPAVEKILRLARAFPCLRDAPGVKLTWDPEALDAWGAENKERSEGEQYAVALILARWDNKAEWRCALPDPAARDTHMRLQLALCDTEGDLLALDAVLATQHEPPLRYEAEADKVRQKSWTDRLAELWRPVSLGWFDVKPDDTPALLSLPESDGGGLFLPAGKTGLLVAPGGSGKSQALAQLAVAVALGPPARWFGTYPVTEGDGGVLLAYGEEDEEEARRRLWKAGQAMALGQDPDPGASERIARMCDGRLVTLGLYGADVRLTAGADDTRTAFLDALLARLEKGPEWRLIVLDPGARFMGAEAEKDNAAATRFMERIEELTKVPGNPAVIVAHHTNKGALKGETDQGAARGSSAFVDGARLALNLEEYAVTRRGRWDLFGDVKEKWRGCAALALKHTKSNYGPKASPLSLRFEKGGILRPVTETEAGELKQAAEALAAEDRARDGKGSAGGRKPRPKRGGGGAARPEDRDWIPTPPDKPRLSVVHKEGDNEEEWDV